MTFASRISVVVPVYNEHENIVPCLRGLAGALDGHEHEILIVYDFDQDTTLGAIAAMPDPPATMRLVKNQIGRGAANAIRAGFAAATGDVVVTTMADLCDPPEKILELASEMRSSGAAVVAASRYMEGGTQEGGPLVKRTLSRCAGLSLRHVAGIGTHDATNNFKAYSKAFLERTRVEAQGAFDIGLELAVKAHLAGAGVAEVPTSWKDRSAGTSRFKVWTWAPKYLRWYGMAMAAPLAVLLAWIAAWAWESRTADWTGGLVGIEAAISAAFAGAALGILALARWMRGRTIGWDALAPWLWCNPFHSRLFHAGYGLLGPALALAATAALLAATVSGPGFARLRRGVIGLLTWRNALFVALTLLVWPYLTWLPFDDDSIALDPSWQRAFDLFLVQDRQSGTESVFTYGPLCALHSAFWMPNTFWARIVLQDGLIKLIGAGFFVAAAFAMRGWIERIAWFVLIGLVHQAQDPAVYFVIASAAAVSLARRRLVGPALFLAAALFAELGFVKFTFQMLAGVGVILIAFETAARGSYRAALGWLAIFAAAYLTFWIAADQSPANLPAYWRGSLEIVEGYGKAQGRDKMGELHFVALVIAGLVAAAGAARLWASRASPRSVAICALTAATMFLAHKAAHIRAPRSEVLVDAASVVPLLFLVGLEPQAARRRLPYGLARALALAACVFALAHTRAAGLTERFGWRAFAGYASESAWRKVKLAAGARAKRAERLAADAALARKVALPRTVAEVGDASIDVLGVHQGIAVLNGLNYRCRPVLQSYSVHTPYLDRINTAYFEGPSAPDYALVRLTAFGGMMPMALDYGATEAVLRRYRPVLSEDGFLLLRRDPERAARPVAAPEVLLSRELAVDQWLEVPEFGERALRLAIEVEETTFSKVRTFLLRGPKPQIDLRLSDGRMLSYRFMPKMSPEGWLIHPFANSHLELVRWMCGSDTGRVVALRWRVPREVQGLFEESAHVRLTAEDAGFREPRLDPSKFVWPIFTPAPSSVALENGAWSIAGDGSERIASSLPVAVRFELPAGRYRVFARVGTGTVSSGDGSGGVTFRLTATAGGTAAPATELRVPGPTKGRTASMRTLRRVVELESDGVLELSGVRGAAGDPSGPYAVLGPVRIRPVAAGAEGEADGEPGRRRPRSARRR
jgi:glycosyltransferase involved in cell wall biosynthesis